MLSFNFITYRGSNYSLLKNNCNSFSEDLCQFLCSTSIPKYILDLPQEFLSTPLGQTLGPLIGIHTYILLRLRLPNTYQSIPPLLTDRIGVGSTSLERESSFDDLNSEIETARVHSLALAENRQVIKDKIAKKEKKKDKRKKRHETNGTSSESEQSNCIAITQNMSEVQTEINGAGAIPSEMLPTERALEDEAKERQVEEERRKNREPPVVFTNIDVSLLILAIKLICTINFKYAIFRLRPN